MRLHGDIQRAGRFVEHDDVRIGRESPGDGDALALAAGKLVREEPGLIRAQAHGLHEPQYLAAALFPRADVEKLHRLADDVPGPAARVQGGIRILKDELAPPPEGGQGVAVQGEDAFPVEQDVAGGGLHKAHDPPGHGGLAAARPRQQQERSLGGHGPLTLHGVQPGQIPGDHRFPGGHIPLFKISHTVLHSLCFLKLTSILRQKAATVNGGTADFSVSVL